MCVFFYVVASSLFSHAGVNSMGKFLCGGVGGLGQTIGALIPLLGTCPVNLGVDMLRRRVVAYVVFYHTSM